MGPCSSKTRESVKHSSFIKDIPDIYYLNRAKGKIIHHNSKVIKKNSLKNWKFSTESAVGYISRKTLLIVGGSLNSELNSNAATIDLATGTIKRVSDLPIPCKEGQIHVVKEWIYYIGAIQHAQGHFCPAPILRFNREKETWEEVKISEKEGDRFKLASLINFGSCLMGKKIIIIGGQKISKLGNLKANKIIYSLSIENDFVIKAEGSLPIKLIKPVIASGDRHGIITGGKIPKTGQINQACYYLNMKSQVLSTHLIDPLTFNIEENYPPIYTGNYALFISFPNIAIRYRDKYNWVVFKMKGHEITEEKSVITKPSQITEPVASIKTVSEINPSDMLNRLSNISSNRNSGKNHDEVKDLNRKNSRRSAGSEKFEISLNSSSSDKKKNREKSGILRKSNTSYMKSEDIPKTPISHDKPPEHNVENSSNIKRDDSLKIINPTLEDYTPSNATTMSIALNNKLNNPVKNFKVPRIEIPSINVDHNNKDSPAVVIASSTFSDGIISDSNSVDLPNPQRTKFSKRNRRFNNNPQIVSQRKALEEGTVYIKSSRSYENISPLGSARSSKPTVLMEKIEESICDIKEKAKTPQIKYVIQRNLSASESSPSSSGSEYSHRSSSQGSVSSDQRRSNKSSVHREICNFLRIDRKSCSNVDTPTARKSIVDVKVYEGDVLIQRPRSSNGYGMGGSFFKNSENQIDDIDKTPHQINNARLNRYTSDHLLSPTKNNKINNPHINQSRHNLQEKRKKTENKKKPKNYMLRQNNPKNHQIFEREKSNKEQEKLDIVKLQRNNRIKSSSDSSNSSYISQEDKKIAIDEKIKNIRDNWQYIEDSLLAPKQNSLSKHSSKEKKNKYSSSSDSDKAKKNKEIKVKYPEIKILKDIKADKKSSSDSRKNKEKSSKIQISLVNDDTNFHRDSRNCKIVISTVPDESNSSIYSSCYSEDKEDAKIQENFEYNFKLNSKKSDYSSSCFSDSSNSSSLFKQNQDRPKKQKSIHSVSSSEVSDDENDKEVTFNKNIGMKFLYLVSDYVKLNSFCLESDSYDIEFIYRYMMKITPKQIYTIEGDFFSILKKIHEIEGKAPLREKEYWNIVMISGLLPGDIEINQSNFAYALSRALKYILMRKG